MKSFLAVDLGGSQCRVAVTDEHLQLRGRISEPTDHSTGPESVVAQIARLCGQSCAATGLQPRDVAAIVVASPGPLDTTTGTVFDPPNLLGWSEVPLGKLLTDSLNLPVTIVNDANAAALGEFYFGAGRGANSLVYLTISTGIGGGVVVAGRLLEGTSGSGGELGHMTIDRNGPQCPCGNIGCVEAIASGRAIVRRYVERVGTPPGSGPVVPAISAKEIATMALRGDEPAREIFRDAATAVGVAVVNCINIFNPDVVLLGGGLTGAGDLLFGPVRQVVDCYALARPRLVARILMAELGPDVGLVGAAGYAAAFGRRAAN